MLEDMYTRSVPPKKFDENQHIDTGEIDPDTGERFVYIPEPTYTQTITSEVHFSDKDIIAEKRGVCKHCHQDPCSTDCMYR